MSQPLCNETVPAFSTRSHPLARGLGVLALCAALAGGFLSTVWTSPRPATSAQAADVDARVAAPAPRAQS